MRRMVKGSLFVGTCLFLAQAASAQDVAKDIEKGREFARNLCSNCHDIGDGVGRSLQAGVPSFSWLAANRTPLQIDARMIQPSHPDMPEAPLTPADRAHVVSYITSLAGK